MLAHRNRRPSGLAVVVVGAVLGPWSPAVLAQTVYDVFPVEPDNGAIVGPRPRLFVGVDGDDLSRIQYRVELSRDGFDTIDYTFDQRAESNGWAFVGYGFDHPGAMYNVREPLQDGEYEWRVSAWSGIQWITGETTYDLIVDGTPPAAVDGVRLRVDEELDAVVLDWDPVAIDAEGKPEYVAKYHVYRYFRVGPFFVIRPYQIAETRDTHYEDTDSEAVDSSIVFYKITAEDEAGNEPERRF